MKIFHTVLRDWFFFSLDLQSTPYPYVFIPSLKDWIFPLIRNGSYVLSYVLWQCPEYVSSLISNCKLETRCIYLATRFSVIQHRKPTDYRNPLLFKSCMLGNVYIRNYTISSACIYLTQFDNTWNLLNFIVEGKKIPICMLYWNVNHHVHVITYICTYVHTLYIHVIYMGKCISIFCLHPNLYCLCKIIIHLCLV